MFLLFAGMWVHHWPTCWPPPLTLPGCDLACIVAPPRDGVRLPVINYNMHKVGLIARITISFRFILCLLNPFSSCVYFGAGNNPSVRLKSVPKSKENVVNFYLILRLGSTPSLLLLPHGSRMDLLAVTTLWVSHNIGNIVGRIILRIRVGIILSWYYSTSITTPYYYSIIVP